jgi:hypothetical protein
MKTCCDPEILGANPANVKWNVVRGDTAKLRVEFLDNDEVTSWDISDWVFSSSSYDAKADVIDELEVVVDPDGKFLDIIASSEITSFWGTGYRSTVAELSFDLQVELEDETIWTPVVGTINVLADISGGL